MDLNEIKLDTTKEIEGVWVPLDDDTSLKIARMDNPEYKKLYQKLIAPYVKGRHLNNTQDVLLKNHEKIQDKAMSEAILLDWKGITNNGEEYPYSKKAAYELLTNPGFASLKSFILSVANDLALYVNQEVEEALEKPSPTSNGKTNLGKTEKSSKQRETLGESPLS